MLPSHLKLDNFKGNKKKESDWLCKILTDCCELDLERLKKLPLPTFLILVDYWKRMKKH